MKIYKITQVEPKVEPKVVSLEGFLDYWKQEGLSVYVHDRGSDIVLNELIVPKIDRKQGIGTKFMMGLTDIADKLNKRILLTPDTAYGATSIGRLQKFYKRFGFVLNKGRNKDYSISDGMFRSPR